MTLKKGKHITKEINGTYCTVVESGISKKRMEFLKGLLEFNQFEAKVEETPAKDDAEASYTIGVSDLVFNPVIAVYEKSLKRPDGVAITPAYWNQEKEIDSAPYFEYRERDKNAKNMDDFPSNPWAYRTM